MTLVASITRQGYRTDEGLWDEVTLTKGQDLVATVPVKISKTALSHDETLRQAGYEEYEWDFTIGDPATIPLDKLFFTGHNAPITEVPTIDAFAPHTDEGASRYRHFYTPDRPLDALLINKGSDTLVVHLHGATDRSTTTLPRFERLATIAQEDVTSLFFSDPTLHVHEAIQLTWYTGWEGVDVQQHIADWAKQTARTLGIKNIIIAGSSGGGFASLQISALIPGSWALPMNPQTSIHKYYVGGDPNVRGIQRAYIRRVHPEIAEGPIDQMDLTPDWTLKLGDEVSTLRRYSKPVDNQILFVQNTNDWHYEQHWLPFLEACQTSGNDKNIELITYEGPKAHVAPDKETFAKGLKAVLDRVKNAAASDDRYDAEIVRVSKASEIPWAELSEKIGERFRIVVQQSPRHLPLEMLYIPRGGDRLIVGLHGAEQRSQITFPKFQFVNSLLIQRTESLLFLADTTLTLDEALGIGWMVGNAHNDVAESYGHVIRSLNHATGIQQTVLLGHSAGATAAIRLGTLIPDSLAIGVNPQLSVDLHRPWLIPKLRKAAFPEYGTDFAMMAAHRERFDLTVALGERAPGSTFVWFSHIDDPLSFEEYPHFPVLCDFLGLAEHGGITASGDRVYACRWETSNPNKHALPGGILPFLSFALGEEPSIDLSIVTHQ